jgi:hypothetical protein
MVESVALIAAAALLAGALTFVLWKLTRRKQRDRAWRALAQKHGMTFAASPPTTKGKGIWINLDGYLEAFQCSVALEHCEKMGLSAVARFKISPPLEPKSDRQVAPAAQGVTGDVQFDTRFVIPADAAVLDALCEEVRDDLLEATEGLDAVGTISPKGVSLRIVAGLDKLDALDRLVETAKAVAKIVADTRRVAAVED